MSRLLLLFPLIFLLSCSSKSYKSEESSLITIKSEKLKYSDMGFIRRGENRVEVKLFTLGKEALHLEIDTLICLNGSCMPQSLFHSQYLSGEYPSDTLKNILLSKPIFSGKNLIKTDSGFFQNFDSISYSTESGKTVFRDRKENIFIKIKKGD